MDVFPFYPLPVQPVTASAAEVQLTEILQRIEATRTGQATSVAQQVTATDARFAQVDTTVKSDRCA